MVWLAIPYQSKVSCMSHKQSMAYFTYGFTVLRSQVSMNRLIVGERSETLYCCQSRF